MPFGRESDLFILQIINETLLSTYACKGVHERFPFSTTPCIGIIHSMLCEMAVACGRNARFSSPMCEGVELSPLV